MGVSHNDVTVSMNEPMGFLDNCDLNKQNNGVGTCQINSQKVGLCRCQVCKIIVCYMM